MAGPPGSPFRGFLTPSVPIDSSSGHPLFFDFCHGMCPKSTPTGGSRPRPSLPTVGCVRARPGHCLVCSQTGTLQFMRRAHTASTKSRIESNANDQARCKSGIQDNGGTMYYIKCKVTGLDKWPWIFVKIYEPELVTLATPVAFRGLKKMKEEFKLVTF